jgi:hypothetical protein
MDGARGLFGDLSFTFSWLFSFLHVCNAGFIARLAGHFFGDMKRRILALTMGPREPREESGLQARNNKTTNGFEDLFSVCFRISLGSSNDMPSMNLSACCRDCGIAARTSLPVLTCH